MKFFHAPIKNIFQKAVIENQFPTKLTKNFDFDELHRSAQVIIKFISQLLRFFDTVAIQMRVMQLKNWFTPEYSGTRAIYLATVTILLAPPPPPPQAYIYNLKLRFNSKLPFFFPNQNLWVKNLLLQPLWFIGWNFIYRCHPTDDL